MDVVAEVRGENVRREIEAVVGDLQVGEIEPVLVGEAEARGIEVDPVPVIGEQVVAADRPGDPLHVHGRAVARTVARRRVLQKPDHQVARRLVEDDLVATEAGGASGRLRGAVGGKVVVGVDELPGQTQIGREARVPVARGEDDFLIDGQRWLVRGADGGRTRTGDSETDIAGPPDPQIRRRRGDGSGFGGSLGARNVHLPARAIVPQPRLTLRDDVDRPVQPRTFARADRRLPGFREFRRLSEPRLWARLLADHDARSGLHGARCNDVVRSPGPRRVRGRQPDQNHQRPSRSQCGASVPQFTRFSTIGRC